MTKSRLDGQSTVVAAERAKLSGNTMSDRRSLSVSSSSSKGRRDKKNKQPKRRKASLFSCFAPGLDREQAYSSACKYWSHISILRSPIFSRSVSQHHTHSDNVGIL